MAITTPTDDWRTWPDEEKDGLLDDLLRRRRSWKRIARAEQLPPDWPWFVWLILAGRGWGKTRTGAEWAIEKARTYAGCRIALVAQAFADGRDTMVEGESGLLSILEDFELRGGSRDAAWNRSLGELFLANDSRFKVFSSEKPRQLRGPQHHFAWGDEPATWYDAHVGYPSDPQKDVTWPNMEMGLRLTLDGSVPQAVATGTPKPVALLMRKGELPGLLHRTSTAITAGHTDENYDNLAPGFRTNVVNPLRGTRLGRQELAAEILEDVEGALWKRSWFDREGFRVHEWPLFWQRAPVVGVDPADGTEDGAEHAYTVVGLGSDHDLYVIESEGLHETPYQFARRVIEVAQRHGGMLVVERNHGQGWLGETFRLAMRDMSAAVPLKLPSAQQNKKARAQPVAGLYEQGRVHHVGHHPELEDQLTSFTGAPNEKSPDRLDSLVWAMAEFTGLSFGPQESAAPVSYTDRVTDPAVVAWS